MPLEESLDVDRRSWLKAMGAGAVGLAAAGETSAQDRDTYDEVVNVAEEGAARDASEPINDVLEEHRGDSVLFEFPEGRYLLDRTFRHTGFEEFGMAGDGATIVPAPADEFSGEARLFKLGTHYEPGRNLRIENFTVDFTADNTGLRAFQCQVADDLQVRNVEFEGQHDAGTWGPMLADLVDADGSGVVENVRMAGGGEFTRNTAQDADPAVDTGPTGIIVSPYHRGELVVRNCVVGPFPDNGLYDSSTDGTVVVEGGSYRNSNVANVRLAGNSVVRGVEIVVDQNRDHDYGQRGIRLDDGSQFHVTDTSITLAEPNGEAIRVTDSAGEALFERLDVTLDESSSSNDAIRVSGDAGKTTIRQSSIEIDCPGQALEFDSGDGDPVLVEEVTVTGDATGEAGGRHAIRCDCGGCELVDVEVSQPGPGYRRALHLGGDGITVSGGEYHSTHHPIVNRASDTRIDDVVAWADGETEAVKLYGGNQDVELVYSTLYEGYVDRGTENLTTTGNEYPEGEPSDGNHEHESSETESESEAESGTESDSNSGSTETEREDEAETAASAETESGSEPAASEATATESSSPGGSSSSSSSSSASSGSSSSGSSRTCSRN